MKLHLKQTIYLLIITFIFSCNKDDGTSVNQSPKIFKVNAIADAKGLGIQLNWEAAIDPDNDAVTYNVFLGDTLIAEELTVKSFVFNASAYNTLETGTVVAKDSFGAEKSVSFSVTSSSLVVISDTNFERALINFGTDSDNLINGQINIKDVLSTTFLSIASANISDLTGIEAFTNLTNLNCDSNNLSSVDFSKNIKLTVLNCKGNDFNSLDISQNINLTELQCRENNLNSLDVSQNINLAILDISHNDFASVDVSQNTKLLILGCSSNSLRSLDVSKNTSLTSLNCGDNVLTTLDVSLNINLTGLICSNNNLNNLNIKNGNNTNMSINATDNPNLISNTSANVCVDIVPPTTAIQNGFDAGVSYKTTCN